MKVLDSSAWPEAQVIAYLRETTLPLRLACIGRDGFPLINSLWFHFEANAIWCAVHRDSVLARRFANDPRCGFELAPNHPPYLGIRGQGTVTLLPEVGGATLEQLIDRFLGDGDGRLRNWLLSRVDEEVAIRITPTWISSWDYRHRMEPSKQ